MNKLKISLGVFIFSILCFAEDPLFTLSLKDAETKAMGSSEELKAMGTTVQAAHEHADAQFSALLPKLSLNANYNYLEKVPTMSFGGPAFPFGAHDNYSVGPVLSYMLFTGGALSAYRGLNFLAESKSEEKKNGEIQTLLGVRTAYLHLQLTQEELKLLGSSLTLARAQNKDIETNFRAGAASKLDRVDSQREVLNYQLQFEQSQSEVRADLQDLLTWIHLESPAALTDLQTQIKLDSLDQSLAEANTWTFNQPDDQHPKLKGQELLAQSADKSADAQMAALYPTIQLTAAATYQYPFGPILIHKEQTSVGVSVSLPLFEGNHSRHLAAEKRLEADTHRLAKAETQLYLQRDYTKAQELLQSLRDRRKISTEDVEHSQEAAKLYYQSYKGGRLSLTDVMGANNRALLSQVNAARLDAQILSQLYLLKSLSGEKPNGQ